MDELRITASRSSPFVRVMVKRVEDGQMRGSHGVDVPEAWTSDEISAAIAKGTGVTLSPALLGALLDG